APKASLSEKRAETDQIKISFLTHFDAKSRKIRLETVCQNLLLGEYRTRDTAPDPNSPMKDDHNTRMLQLNTRIQFFRDSVH
uniref:Uncharacterized protein n=1 Tax=Romanomermis culicivorax TaxID=13658 RepID=A0A915JCJ6_ROMCU